MTVLKWVSCILCLLALGLPYPDCASSPPETPGIGDLNCYLVQMHIHGHSNHNGNDLPASMESHCYEAKRHGFDVIWWTDHARLFETYEDIGVGFGTAFVDSSRSAILFAEGRARELTRFHVERPADGCDIRIENGRLILALDSDPGARDFRKATLTLGSERGKVHTVEFCRPVTSGLCFRSWYEIDEIGADTYLRFRFDFSLHPEGQHHVRFDVVGSAREEHVVSGDTMVVYQVDPPCAGGGVVLDLEEALSLLGRGNDNTLSSCSIEVGARWGSSITVTIDSLVIRSLRAGGENQYRVVEAFNRSYQREYGITQYTGVEIGLFHTSRLPHMNAYLPVVYQTFESISLAQGLARDAWIAEIHDMRGLVSLNHPFGASLRPRRGRGPDYPSGLSIRELSRMRDAVEDEDFWDVAEPILESDGLGADILEVGYLFRGIGTLEDHLRLWDLALANGVRLVGNGASDTHGGRWGPDMVPNPFASWIWAASDGQNDLLEALRLGHVAFGDPFLWKSKFAFGVEDVMMGDTLAVAEGDEVTGWIRMEPRRDDIEVRLVQVRIKPGRDLEVLRNEVVPYGREGFPIKVEDACFARIEIYGRDGTPLVFSNPVFLIP
jgi:hypothetical protein